MKRAAPSRLHRHPPRWQPISLQGQRVLVVGLGRFGGGLGAALHLLREGAEVTVTDLASEAELGDAVEQVSAAGARLELGCNRSESVRDHDWVVASPAVPWSADVLQEAIRRDVPVESEITLLLRLLPCRCVGITGTNGKSTTVSLAARTLRATGRSVFSGGNLGGSLLDRVGTMGREDLVVLELSSFQLAHLQEIGLGPEVALITNLSPDHLDRHGTMRDYVEAKAAILERARVAFLNGDDPRCRALSERFDGPVRWFGSRAEEESRGDLDYALVAGRFATTLGEADQELRVDLSGMKMAGIHNRLNLMAAAALATWFGAPFDEAIREGLSLRPLRQRLQVIASVGGVRYVDDSICTSPPAVRAAVSSFEGGIRLLVGGYDKGLDPQPLLDVVLGQCRKTYLFGAVASSLAQRLEQLVAQLGDRARRTDALAGCSWEVHPDLETAFRAASREACAGEVVLLSPGHASYDQFRNVAERGARFQALVRDLGAS